MAAPSDQQGVILETRRLGKRFGGVHAVNGVTLSIPSGDVRAIIGPNGAGKTTLFNLITGDLSHDTGDIYFAGENVNGLPPHLLCRRGMGRTFQITSVFRRLTALENVQTALLAHHRRHFNFLARARRLYRAEPRLLLLDEPTAGMAPRERHEIMALVGKIAADTGLTVIFTEHDMDVVFAVARRITVLHQGMVLADDVPAAVRANAEVQRVYLGQPVAA
jgi:branched-chain amino acid transport system ATP-binding protein